MAGPGDITAALLASLKQADPDRYLATLYAPARKRRELVVLYAFNAELASIRDRVSQPLPGEIRLQWWRDVLTGNADPGGEPLAMAMRDLIAAHGIPPDALDRCFDARLFDLYDDAVPDRTFLEAYCGETAGLVIQIASMILGEGDASRFGEIAGHAACAQAMTGLIRSIPLHRSRGQCYVPAEILAAAGLDRDQWLRQPGDSAAIAIAALVSLAREHHGAFSRRAKDLPSGLLAAYLPLAPVPAYLRSIEKAGGEAASKPLATSALRRNWLFLRTALRGFAG